MGSDERWEECGDGKKTFIYLAPQKDVKCSSSPVDEAHTFITHPNDRQKFMSQKSSCLFFGCFSFVIPPHKSSHYLLGIIGELRHGNIVISFRMSSELLKLSISIKVPSSKIQFKSQATQYYSTVPLISPPTSSSALELLSL